MTTGVITSITQDWRGDTLVDAAAAIDTVLVLEDAGDFDEDPTATRWVLVGDESTPREYVAVDMDADTITLADPVGGSGLDVGEPVVLWDPTVGDSGSRAVEYIADVELHDDSGTAPAVIPHALIPSSGVYGLVGASVSVEEDDEDADWYVGRVLGRENVVDGSYVDPDTLPDVEAPTDPPASSPAITAVGLTASMILRAEPVEPTTEITYQISTDYDPDSPGSATWNDLPDTPTRTTVYSTGTLADGTTALLPETVYWFRSIASNVAGPADDPSAVVSGELNQDAVAVVADAVLTERLDSTLVVTGRVEVGAGHWDPTELVLPGLGGQTTRFSMDGTTPHTIDGHIVGRSATFEDNTNLFGLTQVGGTVRLQDGITNPVVEPGVSRTWDHLETTVFDLPYSEYHFGLTDNSAGTRWVTAIGLLGEGTVVEIDKTTGTQVTAVAVPDFQMVGGIVRIGTSFYALGQDRLRSYAWFVYIFNSSFTKTGEWNYPGEPTSAYKPAIGRDSANVVIARCAGVGPNAGKPVVRTYTTAGSPTSSGETGAAAVVTSQVLNADIGFVYVGSADFGGNKIALCRRAGTSGLVTYAATTGALDATHAWTRANAQPVNGVAWDGTLFHSLDANGRVWHYTARPVDADVDVGYTWYDGHATGGTHESMISDKATFSWASRSQLVVSLPPAPEVGGAGTDVANGHRVYVGPAAGTVRLQATPSVGTTTVTLDSLDTGSATPPGTNGFDALAATAGRMESTGEDGSGVPHTLLEGDGSARIVKLAQAGDASVTVTASTTGSQAVVFPEPFDVVPAVTASATSSSFYVASANSATTTGFTLTVRHINATSGTATVDADWIAVVKTV